MAACPFADQSRRYDKRYPGAYRSGFGFRGVLHTTETTGLPGYGGGASAPHFTIDPRSGRIWQHYDTARPSRALKHPAGTIDTNNAYTVQVEVIAYSDTTLAARVGGLRVDKLTAAQRAPVAKLMRWIADTHPVRPVSGLTFKAYPASAGTSNGVRLSTSVWRNFRGWCGHQHVPVNDHGDPGSLAIAALLAQLEDDMQLSDLVSNAWTPPAKPGGKPTFEPISVNEALRRSSRTYYLATELRDDLRTLSAAVKAQAAAINALAGAQGLDQAAVTKAIEDAVADALADLRIVPAQEG